MRAGDTATPPRYHAGRAAREPDGGQAAARRSGTGAGRVQPGMDANRREADGMRLQGFSTVGGAGGQRAMPGQEDMIVDIALDLIGHQLDGGKRCVASHSAGRAA